MTMQKLRFMLQMMIVILAFPVLFITGISYPKVKAEAGNSGKKSFALCKKLKHYKGHYAFVMFYR